MQFKQYKQNILKIILWSAVLIGMAGIFFLSAQTASESDTLSGKTIRIIAGVLMPQFEELSKAQQAKIVMAWQHIARKTAHALLYLVLGLLCMAALLQHSLDMKVRTAIALCISAGYAVTDEIHQLFVPGRGTQFSDVCIDACGALIGILLVVLVHRLLSKRAGNRSV